MTLAIETTANILMHLLRLANMAVRKQRDCLDHRLCAESPPALSHHWATTRTLVTDTTALPTFDDIVST